MSVETLHPEYKKYIKKKWPTMRDSLAGEDEVKEKKQTYLPGFIPNDEERYKSYILRALYVAFTSRTAIGLNGAIYRKPPVIDLPSTLEYMKEDADGSGQGLEQVLKEATEEVLGVSRVGILLDKPPKKEGATREDDLNNNLRANFSIYKAESIINWKTIKIGGATILTMVVLAEVIDKEMSSFETEYEKQYRVLALDSDGKYYQQVYTDTSEKDKASVFEPKEPVYPTNENGDRWDFIPFNFIGADNNTPDIDEPPLYPMALINIGHYRNSADYEEGVHMMGQPSLFIDVGNISLSEWNEQHPNGVKIGSRKGNALGAGGKAYLLNMPSNTAAKEAMDQKEQQIVSIGAKLIESSGRVQTAEEARINASADNSVLNTIVGNTEDAFNTLSRWATEFEGGNPEEVSININRDFFPYSLTGQQIMAIIALADRADIAQSDVRALLRKTEYLHQSRTDEDIDGEIEGEGI